MAYFPFSNQTPITMFDTLTRRNLAHGGKLMMIHVEIPSGGLAPPHSHPHEQVTYLLEGRAEVRVGEETYQLSPGDSVYVAPNRKHEMRALEDCRVLDVFTPKREDLLQ